MSFKLCLEEVKTWSDRHPEHIPITFLLEFKDPRCPCPRLRGRKFRKHQAEITEDATAEESSSTLADPLPWTPDRMSAAKNEIRSVFPLEEIISPDSVRKDAATLDG